MNTAELLNSIKEWNPEIEFFSIHQYMYSRLIQDEASSWGAKEEAMFKYAIDLKNKYCLPFWSGIMLSSFDNKDYSEQILATALRHNPIKELLYIKTSDIPNHIDSFCALCSKVILKDGSEKHIPMIDFHIPPSPDNLNVVKSVCKFLGLSPGWILNSGESYHFIGGRIVTWETIYEILAKSILYNPIVDIAWVSHQLREVSCSLRIGEKNGRAPIVEYIVE